MNWRPFNWRALLAGMASSAVPGLLILLAWQRGAFDRAPNGEGGWIYEFQGLIGGVLAIAGAALATRAVYAQMRQSAGQLWLESWFNTVEARSEAATAAFYVAAALDKCVAVLRTDRPADDVLSIADDLRKCFWQDPAYRKVRYFFGQQVLLETERLIRVLDEVTRDIRNGEAGQPAPRQAEKLAKTACLAAAELRLAANNMSRLWGGEI